jgi:hypothetical protein
MTIPQWLQITLAVIIGTFIVYELMIWVPMILGLIAMIKYG